VSIAALVISIIAIIVAIGGLIDTRRQTSIEASRRHDEMKPQLRLEHSGTPGGPDEALELTLLGPNFYYENIHGVLMSELAGGYARIAFVDENEDLQAAVHLDGLSQGLPQPLPIRRLTNPAPDRVSIGFTLQSTGDEWNVLVECLIPPIPEVLVQRR
jgi:hypothetical protein